MLTRKIIISKSDERTLMKMRKLLPVLIAVCLLALIAVGIGIFSKGNTESDTAFDGAVLVCSESNIGRHDV